jgi:putative transposase
MGISRQAYYQGLSRQDEVRQCNERAIESVRSKRLRQPRLGTRKLHHLLSDSFTSEGLKVGRDALFSTLRQSHMLVASKRAYHKATNSHHRFRCYPDLLKAGSAQVRPTAAEQVWVVDITYVPTHGGFFYLSLITDVYSRKIIGHHVHDSLRTEQVSQTLKVAL